MEFVRLEEKDDAALAALIRRLLKAHGLDIPGTVYFDKGLDHLSTFYQAAPEKRAYFVLREGDKLLGGIGLAEFPPFPECAELQKLYLSEEMRGRGIGYQFIACAEQEARRLGYRQMYLETHDNLRVALHLYERSGYMEIARPAATVHSTMNRFFLKPLL